ncbi:hypothetical protein BH10PLA1_BH10PLA1_10920 [soil metagenome]
MFSDAAFGGLPDTRRKRRRSTMKSGATMPNSLPGNGFFGWLGRQVGHVVKATKAEVPPVTLYEKKEVLEQPHPADPSLILRRTTTDQVVKSPAATGKSDTSL